MIVQLCVGHDLLKATSLYFYMEWKEQVNQKIV